MTAPPELRGKAPLGHRLRQTLRISAFRLRAQSYSAAQLAHARAIVAVCHQRGFIQRGAVIAIETAMTESSIQVYANKWNTRSLQLPHDAVGSDHGSVGIFQQQVCGAPFSTACWGTTAECMDPTHSTNKFLDELAHVHGWNAMNTWDAAQRVQGSFDPTGGNYKRNEARAVALVAQLWDEAEVITAADIERIRLALVTTDIKNGPGVDLLYQAIGRTEAGVAALQAEAATQTAILNRIATHLGA